MVANDNMVFIFGSKLTENSGFPFNIVLMENKSNIANGAALSSVAKNPYHKID